MYEAGGNKTFPIPVQFMFWGKQRHLQIHIHKCYINTHKVYMCVCMCPTGITVKNYTLYIHTKTVQVCRCLMGANAMNHIHTHTHTKHTVYTYLHVSYGVNAMNYTHKCMYTQCMTLSAWVLGG